MANKKLKYGEASGSRGGRLELDPNLEPGDGSGSGSVGRPRTGPKKIGKAAYYSKSAPTLSSKHRPGAWEIPLGSLEPGGTSDTALDGSGLSGVQEDAPTV